MNCHWCRKDFTPHKNVGARAKFCSVYCKTMDRAHRERTAKQANPNNVLRQAWR